MSFSLIRRRVALARRRILEISCRANLSHRGRGRVLLEGEGVVLCGNITVAVCIASSCMTCRSLARPSMDAMVSCEGSLYPSRRWSPAGRDRESNKQRAIAVASKVGL